MIPRLSDSFDFQAQALTLRAERQRLLAGNIANADTPGYVARDLDFAAALRAATGSAGPAAAALNGLRASLPGGTGAEPQLRWASASQSSLDGNTVDMDRERASIADNGVKYEATLRFLNAQVRTLSDAMKGPNQS